MTPSRVLALATIHIGITAGIKADKLRGTSAVAPKTVIAKTGVVFTPLNDAMQTELIDNRSARLPVQGEDFSQYPVLDLDTGKTAYPARKTQEQLDSEQADREELEARRAEELRQKAENDRLEAKRKQDEEDAEQKRKDDEMRAAAKIKEDEAAAALKAKQEQADADAKVEADAKAKADAKAAKAKAKADALAAGQQPADDAEEGDVV